MKRCSRLIWMAALCAAWSPAIGRAQSAAYYQTGAAADRGVASASAYSATATKGEEAQAPAEECDNSCCGLFGGCGKCGPFGSFCWPCGGKLEDLGEACKLWKPCCEDSQWSMNGWLDQSIVANPDNPKDRFNGPVTWTDRSNDYQMTEFWLGGGRVTKTDGCGWDWGGRVDAFYGSNYRWDTSAGFETKWGTNGSLYGIAVPNAYAELAYNNWTVKAGRFVSPVGYYTVGSPNNFFPVIPYTYQYGEPFTHTGVWAQNKLSDKLTVGAAVTHGWDDTDNTGNPHGGGLLNATYTIDDKRSLAWVGVIGDEPNLSGVNPKTSPGIANGTGFSGRYFQTLVYTRKFSDDVMGVLQSDFGTQQNALRNFDTATGLNDGALRTAKWYGLNSYIYWNMTCRMQWGANAEWFRDQGGFRVGQVLPSFGSPNSRGLPAGRTGYDGSFYRITFGPRYYFTPNVYTRVALLLDWYDGKTNNAGALKPFDDGNKNSQGAVVFDLVATF